MAAAAFTCAVGEGTGHSQSSEDVPPPSTIMPEVLMTFIPGTWAIALVKPIGPGL
jgi:hypothetical protein